MNSPHITRPVFGLLLAGLAGLGVVISGGSPVYHQTAASGSSPGALHAAVVSGARAITFEANQGQSNPKVKFLSHGSGRSLFLTSDESVLTLSRLSTPGKNSSRRPVVSSTSVLHTRLVGANPNAAVEGRNRLPGSTNYFIGNDPAKWRCNVPTYSGVAYSGVYPGIDLVYYGNSQEALEHDFVVAPGADPRKIRFELRGAQSANIQANGDLLLTLADGEVRERKPLVYQTVSGRRKQVEGRYVLLQHPAGSATVAKPDDADRALVAFEIGAYDASRELVIDPVVTYCTYLGGSNIDAATSVAVDGNQNAFVVGYTESTDLPVSPTAYQQQKPGNLNMFVARIDTTKSGTASRVYMTYLGGGGTEGYWTFSRIILDSQDNAYIVGATDSSDYPQVNRMMPPPPGGGGFATVLNPTGSSVLYSTEFGGSQGSTSATCIATDGHYIYVAGQTADSNYPVVNPYQHNLNAGADAFLMKIDPTQTGLAQIQYSTYIGGSHAEYGNGVGFDADGYLYVAGTTESPDFPIVNGFQTQLGGINEPSAFLAKLNPVLSGPNQLVYSTYYGGSGGEDNAANEGEMAMDSQGYCYIEGMTSSLDLPTSAHAFQPNAPNGVNSFIAKFDTTQTGAASLVYGTYVGGNGQDIPGGLFVDSMDRAWITGSTESTNYPLYHPGPLPTNRGNNPFVTALTPDGSHLYYSTILPGPTTWSYGMAVDPGGAIYVVGLTQDNNLATNTGFETFLDGSEIGILYKLSFAGEPPVADAGPDQNLPCNPNGGTVAVTLDGTGSSDPDGDTLMYSWSLVGTTNLVVGTTAKVNLQLPVGTYTYMLTVTDPYGVSSSDNVTITIACPILPPVANPGPNQTVECAVTGDLQTEVTLNGSMSTDPNGDALSYSWSETTVQGTVVVGTTAIVTLRLPKGMYTFTLTVTDTQMATDSASLMVTVQDTTPPVLHLPSSPIQAQLQSPQGAVVNFNVTATDTCGSASVACVPPSGSTFPLGNTTVNCTATDLAGNQTMGSFTVTVVDTTPPMITCPPSAIQAQQQNAQGAVVNFSYQVTASDLSGSVTLVCVPPSGSTFPPGTTPVTCTATDPSGNTSTCTFNVTVVDTTPPQIMCPSNMTVTATDLAEGKTKVVYSVTATDNSGTATVVCTPPSGSSFPNGQTTVTCTATDPSGNQSTCTFTVRVVLSDVTSQFTIDIPKAPKKETRTLTQDVKLTYIGNGLLLPAVSLALQNLPPGVMLMNKTGVTTLASPSPVGTPYISVNVGKGLKTRKSVTVTLKFSEPANTMVTYMPQVLQGPGAR